MGNNLIAALLIKTVVYYLDPLRILVSREGALHIEQRLQVLLHIANEQVELFVAIQSFAIAMLAVAIDIALYLGGSRRRSAYSFKGLDLL